MGRTESIFSSAVRLEPATWTIPSLFRPRAPRKTRFPRLPALEAWAQPVHEAIEREGGLAGAAEKTGLSLETLTRFSLGFLPTRRFEVVQMRTLLGGVDAAETLWIRAWETVADELARRPGAEDDGFSVTMIRWKEREGSLRLKAMWLNGPLKQFFKQAPAPSGGTLLQDIVSLTRISHDPRVRAAADRYSDRELLDLATSVAEETEDGRRSIFKGLCRRVLQRSTPDPKDLRIEDLELRAHTRGALLNARIRWVGELVRRSEEDMRTLRHLGDVRIREIKTELAGYGLSLGLNVEGWVPPAPPHRR